MGVGGEDGRVWGGGLEGTKRWESCNRVLNDYFAGWAEEK